MRTPARRPQGAGAGRADRRSVLREGPGRIRRRRGQARAARPRRPAAQVALREGRHVRVVACAVAQQEVGGGRPAASRTARRSRASSRCAPTSSSRISGPARSRNGAWATTRSPRANPGPGHGAHLRLRPDGPYRERPGFGVIGEAMGGLRHVTGTPDRPPSRAGISIGDTLSALYGVIGAMMALEQRRKTGRGQVVDVALYESVFSVMESMLPEFDAFGAVRERTGSILPGHRADLGVSLQRRQLRADRRQRRFDLQAGCPASLAQRSADTRLPEAHYRSRSRQATIRMHSPAREFHSHSYAPDNSCGLTVAYGQHDLPVH